MNKELTLPVISGHRGFKGKYPENTLLGFEKCYEVGGNGFETDLYLTTDEVLVVCHDANTKRVYCKPNGEEADYNIVDSSYEDDLKDLVNKGTGEKLLTFNHLLNWIKVYGAHGKIMLDIKRVNRLDVTMFMIEEMLLVDKNLDYWFSIFQFGVWDLKFVMFMNQNDYFQSLYHSYGFSTDVDVLHISGLWQSSVQYLEYNHYLETAQPNRKHYKTRAISILYLLTWSTDFVTKFLPLIKKDNIKLYSWTVNNTYQYDYFINICKVAHLEEYGLVSDFPDKMVLHRDDKDEDHSETSTLINKVHPTLSQRFSNFIFEFLAGSVIRSSSRPVDFSLTIQGNVKEKININPIFMYVFKVCQRFNIF